MINDHLNLIKYIFYIIFMVFFLSEKSMAEFERKLVLVSTSPSVVNNVFIDAFEKKYPHIKIKLLTTKTPSAIKYIMDTENKPVDLLWSSSVSAFEILKENQLLTPFPHHYDTILNKFVDNENYYIAVALSSYSFMYNVRYTNKNSLPIANNIIDLAKPIYKNHIGMSSPSQSGTTHINIEGLLQSKGWDNGWKIWKNIAANIQIFTKRSVDVPDAVSKGQFGFGIVVDYYGLSYREMGFPVDFHYSSSSPLIPSSIALIKNGANPADAKLFIKYLLSSEGQKLFFHKNVSRLPIDPNIYQYAPKGYSNPFTDLNIDSRFDIKLSNNRYAVVNQLFDTLIIYNIIALKKAATAILEAEKALQGKSNKKAEMLIKEAKDFFYKMPIDNEKTMINELNNIFSNKNIQTTSLNRKEQNKEQNIRSWREFARENYIAAKELAREASRLLATTDYNPNNTTHQYGAFITLSE